MIFHVCIWGICLANLVDSVSVVLQKSIIFQAGQLLEESKSNYIVSEVNVWSVSGWNLVL